jgi:hypothetical protein
MTVYGVTVGSKGPQLNPQVITAMKDLGLTSLRFNLSATVLTDGKGTYNWAVADNFVQQCNDADIEAYYVLKDLPSPWLDSQGLPTPAGMLAYAQAVASRYNGKSGHGKIGVLEVGNEAYSLSSTFYGAQLAAAMNAVYQPVKNINPDLLIVPGALLQRNTQTIESGTATLLQQAAHSMDALNAHTYFGIPGNGSIDPSNGSLPNIPSFPQYIEAMQGVLAQHNVSLPIMVTEFGWATTPNFGRAARTVVSQDLQWQYEKYCYDQAAKLGVARMYVFTLGFASPAPDGMSLVQAGGAKTVAYNGLKAYIAGAPVSDPPPDNGGGNGTGNGSGGPTPAQIAQAVVLLDQAKSLLSGS